MTIESAEEPIPYSAALPRIQQEKEAQQYVCKALDKLPRELMARSSVTLEEIEKEWGVKVGDEIDDLFINAQFPEGWTIKPAVDLFYSDIFDDTGAHRGGIHYRGGPEYRTARLIIYSRYSVVREIDHTRLMGTTVVKDRRNEDIIFTASEFPYQNPAYTAQQEAEAEASSVREAHAWLLENKPEYKLPFTYWKTP